MPPQALSDLVIEILQRSITAPTLYVEIPRDEPREVTSPAKRSRRSRPMARRARGRPRKKPVEPPTLAGIARNLGNGDNGAKLPAHRQAMRAAASEEARAFWTRAEALSATPWKLVASKLNVNEAQSLDSYRAFTLPPNVTAEQASAAFG